eukprot:1153140-Pelagomonas_calceolata.AAC.1
MFEPPGPPHAKIIAPLKSFSLSPGLLGQASYQGRMNYPGRSNPMHALLHILPQQQISISCHSGCHLGGQQRRSDA